MGALNSPPLPHAPFFRDVCAAAACSDTCRKGTYALFCLPAEMANADLSQPFAFVQRALHLPDRPPIIAYGPPGRSAVTGHVATVFGCTGFLGRYLVSKLGA